MTSACPTAIVSPSPCPLPVPAPPVRNRCGPCAIRYSGNPSPWSRTVTTGPSTVKATGGRPCLCALATRLPSTRSNLRRSVSTCASRTTTSCVCVPDARTTRSASRPSWCRSVSTTSRPESSREISNRSSVSPRIVRTRSCTSCVARPSGNSSDAACKPVSGVRSSCATSAVNRCSLTSLDCKVPAMVSSAPATVATSSWCREGSFVRGSSTRASRSPCVIRRATVAVRCSRRVTRVTAKAPTSSVPPIASTDDPMIALSRPVIVRALWA